MKKINYIFGACSITLLLASFHIIYNSTSWIIFIIGAVMFESALLMITYNKNIYDYNKRTLFLFPLYIAYIYTAVFSFLRMIEFWFKDAGIRCIFQMSIIIILMELANSFMKINIKKR